MPFSSQFGATITILTVTLAASVAGDRRRPDPLRLPLDAIPATLDGWTATERHMLEPQILKILEPTSYLSRTYRKGALDLGLFIAYYGEQRTGESMHSPRVCLPGHGWEIREPGTATIHLNGSPVTINRYIIQNAGERRVVLYWYQSSRRIVASEYAGKVLLVRDALMEGRTSGSLVRILLSDTAQAANEGLAFAAAVALELRMCL
jgi:EpsI family protein